MESAMRKIVAASLVAICGMLASVPAQADWVPPFKGNDTGGIIAFALAQQSDARQLAVDHCAYYGKVVKFLAIQAYEGGYISFACRWVPMAPTSGLWSQSTDLLQVLILSTYGPPSIIAIGSAI
jgi:hypothetical protein